MSSDQVGFLIYVPDQEAVRAGCKLFQQGAGFLLFIPHGKCQAGCVNTLADYYFSRNAAGAQTDDIQGMKIPMDVNDRSFPERNGGVYDKRVRAYIFYGLDTGQASVFHIWCILLFVKFYFFENFHSFF
jgi:hypothetical protein